jgi:16S rRNA (cytidine1402-2'-O)-methyltransferase
MPGKNLPPQEEKGRLFVVATPIGNLEDLTFRALDILSQVDAIACEDTRQTSKLLHRYQLKKRMVSYFQPREKQKARLILDLLNQGKDIALVSDAGTPGVSDPGYPLIQQALEQDIRVIPIPGPAAVTAALSASGLPTHRFLFLGFPSPKVGTTANLLRSLGQEPATLVFYLPARRLVAFLRQVEDILGPRKVVVAREMTKRHEEFLRGTPESVLAEIQGKTLKGEITLLVEGLTRRSKR